MGIRMKILKIISTWCSFMYYLNDNIVWLANLGFVKHEIAGVRFKRIKNTFSLFKTILEVLISLITIAIKKKEENRLISKIEQFYEKKIQPDTEWYVILRNIIILRREARYNMIEFAIYSLRMILLTSSLRLVGHSILDPVFVSLCGIGQAFCSVFKSMKGKKNFYKLTIEDIEDKKKKSEMGS